MFRGDLLEFMDPIVSEKCLAALAANPILPTRSGLRRDCGFAQFFDRNPRPGQPNRISGPGGRKNRILSGKSRLIQTRRFRNLGNSNVGGLTVSSAHGGLLQKVTQLGRLVGRCGLKRVSSAAPWCV